LRGDRLFVAVFLLEPVIEAERLLFRVAFWADLFLAAVFAAAFLFLVRAALRADALRCALV